MLSEIFTALFTSKELNTLFISALLSFSLILAVANLRNSAKSIPPDWSSSNSARIWQTNLFCPENPNLIKASLSYDGSSIPLPSSSKMSKACLIYKTSSRWRVIVTQSSGLNFFGGYGCFCPGLIQKSVIFKIMSINYILIRIQNFGIQMKIREIQDYPNPRIRSFLTPFSKYGTRSLSTSQSLQSLNNSNEYHKSYIDFKKVSRPLNLQTSKNPIKIKFQNSHKNENRKESKLIKIAINKIQEKSHKQEKVNKTQDKSSLIVMIQQLKQMIRLLQIENQKLMKKQNEDLIKLSKQNETIKNLQDAINLMRNRAGQLPAYNYQKILQVKVKDEIGIQRKLGQIQKQSYNISKKFDRIVQQFDAVPINSHQLCTFNPKGCKCNCSQQLQKKLYDIEMKKQKQLREIDSLLFSQYFD